MRFNASLERAMLDLESRWDPFQLRLLQAAATADHVETTRQLGELRMREQVDLRCANEFRALGNADRSHAATACFRAAVSYFDEDDAIAIAHDQVEFAKAADEVAREQQQSRARKVRERRILPSRADVSRHGNGAALICKPFTGCGVPLSKRAHVSRRWTRPRLSSASCPVAPAR